MARLGGFFALGFAILTPPSAHSATSGEESEGGGLDPIEHYGDLDLVMQRKRLEQRGAIKRFLA